MVLITPKTVEEGRGSRLVLDLAIVSVLLFLLWRVFGGGVWLKATLTLIIFWLFVPNWLTGFTVESLGLGENDGYEGVRIKNNPLATVLAPGMIRNMTVSTASFLSGAMQLYGKIFGNDAGRYTVSKKIVLGHLSSYCRYVELSTRPVKSLPRKFFIMTQHVPFLIDIFSFLHFIPESYRMIVVHDVRVNTFVKKFVERVFLNPIYGAVIIDKSNKSSMKTTLENLVREITETPDPVVVVFWPSGRAWDKRHPNGVEKFSNGGFILSTFTGFPSCVVHSRVIDGEERLVSRRSEFIDPPVIPPEERKNYNQFVEACQGGGDGENDLGNAIGRYRERVEKVYRRMDGEIARL